MHGIVAACAHARQDEVVAGNAEQAETHDEQAGDRTATKGDVQSRVDAPGRRFGGAHVGSDRDVHADVAGEPREDRADDEADRGCPAQGREAKH